VLKQDFSILTTRNRNNQNNLEVLKKQIKP